MLKFIRNLQYISMKWYYRKRGIKIGKNTFISLKAYIDYHKNAKITIGNNCFITRSVIILNHTDTHLGGPRHLYVEYGGGRISKDVVIGDNVFIGVNSVVLPGVCIGDNSIIGASSLVNKDVPANTVFAGIPAKMICTLEDHLLKKFPEFKIDQWSEIFSRSHKK